MQYHLPVGSAGDRLTAGQTLGANLASRQNDRPEESAPAPAPAPSVPAPSGYAAPASPLLMPPASTPLTTPIPSGLSTYAHPATAPASAPAPETKRRVVVDSDDENASAGPLKTKRRVVVHSDDEDAEENTPVAVSCASQKRLRFGFRFPAAPAPIDAPAVPPTPDLFQRPPVPAPAPSPAPGPAPTPQGQFKGRFKGSFLTLRVLDRKALMASLSSPADSLDTYFQRRRQTPRGEVAASSPPATQTRHFRTYQIQKSRALALLGPNGSRIQRVRDNVKDVNISLSSGNGTRTMILSGYDENLLNSAEKLIGREIGAAMVLVRQG